VFYALVLKTITQHHFSNFPSDIIRTILRILRSFIVYFDGENIISTRIHLSGEKMFASYIGTTASDFSERTLPLNIVIKETESFSFYFKIIHHVYWIATGMVRQDLMYERKSYSLINHGFYVFSSNGYTWHSDLGDGGCSNTGHFLRTDEIVKMSYNGDLQSITLTSYDHEGSFLKESVLASINRSPDSPFLVPIVMLYYNEEKVELKREDDPDIMKIKASIAKNSI